MHKLSFQNGHYKDLLLNFQFHRKFLLLKIQKNIYSKFSIQNKTASYIFKYNLTVIKSNLSPFSTLTSFIEHMFYSMKLLNGKICSFVCAYRKHLCFECNKKCCSFRQNEFIKKNNKKREKQTFLVIVIYLNNDIFSKKTQNSTRKSRSFTYL